jgi:hypothetical protein
VGQGLHDAVLLDSPCQDGFRGVGRYTEGSCGGSPAAPAGAAVVVLAEVAAAADAAVRSQSAQESRRSSVAWTCVCDSSHEEKQAMHTINDILHFWVGNLSWSCGSSPALHHMPGFMSICLQFLSHLIRNLPCACSILILPHPPPSSLPLTPSCGCAVYLPNPHLGIHFHSFR